jgi:MFS family permease
VAPSSLFSLSSRASPTSSLGLADRFGRKKVLIAGWLVGVTVPFMIMLATSWGWIVAANVLLGVNQSLAWSMTVIMKIDLVVGLTALATGYLASVYGLRPEPFYLGPATPCSGSSSPFSSCGTHGST